MRQRAKKGKQAQDARLRQLERCRNGNHPAGMIEHRGDQTVCRACGARVTG